jgi:hypothetical protein
VLPSGKGLAKKREVSAKKYKGFVERYVEV